MGIVVLFVMAIPFLGLWAFVEAMVAAIKGAMPYTKEELEAQSEFNARYAASRRRIEEARMLNDSLAELTPDEREQVLNPHPQYSPAIAKIEKEALIKSIKVVFVRCDGCNKQVYPRDLNLPDWITVKAKDKYYLGVGPWRFCVDCKNQPACVDYPT